MAFLIGDKGRIIIRYRWSVLTDAIYTANTSAAAIAAAQEQAGSFAKRLVQHVQRGRELVSYCVSPELGYP